VTLTANGRVADRIGIGKGITGTVNSGIGCMGGRDVVVARSYSLERRGALTYADGLRLAESADLARRLRIPLVFIVASSGADVLDGVAALHGWGQAAAAIAACSGVVPVLMAATGPVVSGPALLLGLADLVVMNPEAVAFVSGPQMVAEFTGVEVGLRELGGVTTHARSSGVCAVETDDVEGALAAILEHLPSHADEIPPAWTVTDPVLRSTPELRELIPERKAATYDVRDVVRHVVDDGEFLELWPRWAGQIVTGLCHLGGVTVGIVANQPRILAGTLDIAASQKAARFVRFCDSFNLPIVSLVDTPGFLPGKDLEWRGMIRHGAELAFAYAQATVPRICLILRKAFGGAYIVMDSRGIGNDICLAWPAAEIAVMGASGAVQILHRGIEPGERSDRETEYEEAFLNPWPASERGLVDQVIDPGDTRIVLCSVLRQLETKRELLVGRKHDGGPQ
jgi:acetyl-CoA carboxylase carboxyltransferase component